MEVSSDSLDSRGDVLDPFQLKELTDKFVLSRSGGKWIKVDNERLNLQMKNEVRKKTIHCSRLYRDTDLSDPVVFESCLLQ